MARSRPDLRRGQSDRAWRDFASWCKRHRLQALPAHPWAVAAYLRWCDNRRIARPIDRELAAIARIHLLRGERPPDRDPTVLRTLRAIAMRRDNRAAAADLFEPVIADARKAPPSERSRRMLRMTPRLVRRRRSP